MELTTEKIEELVREARDSGYPVVKLLSDGSIGHYFDKQTTEMDNTPHPIITLESLEVMREFESGSEDWDDFVRGYAQDILDDFGEEVE
jgi:hypothetical protein